MQADYKDGILTLDLPKVEDNSNKAIKVSLNGSSLENAQEGSQKTEASSEGE